MILHASIPPLIVAAGMLHPLGAPGQIDVLGESSLTEIAPDWYDEFTGTFTSIDGRADDTISNGLAWARTGGQIRSDAVYDGGSAMENTGGTNRSCTAYKLTASTNYRIRARIGHSTENGNYAYGCSVVLRGSRTAHATYADAYCWAGGLFATGASAASLQLYNVVAGVSTVRASVVPTVANFTPYILDFRVQARVFTLELRAADDTLLETLTYTAASDAEASLNVKNHGISILTNGAYTAGQHTRFADAKGFTLT